LDSLDIIEESHGLIDESHGLVVTLPADGLGIASVQCAECPEGGRAARRWSRARSGYW